MRIGIPKEPDASQTLVAASPDTVSKLIKLGYEVCVEAGAGVGASYYDDQYKTAGAQVVKGSQAWEQDIVICLDTPPKACCDLLKKGALLVARMNPGANAALIEELSQREITAIAMDAVPRISRAQALDVRSSMANIGGYRAIIEAASAFGRVFTGQVTAAGKMPPARVYVVGVGVAGLAAIGTAASMGAMVFATDVRPEVADQVESLGATFVEIPVKQESSDGYAKEMTEDQQARVLEVYKEQASLSDIVITTAQIPGRPSPLLLTEEAVLGMKPGSVIVDMGASAQGSNCALTKVGEIVHTDNGISIIGYADLPSRLPGQASQLYGQNIVNFFKLVTAKKDGVPLLDENDEVVRAMMVVREGQIMWPPPPVKVSAAPKAALQTPVVATEQASEPVPAWRKWWWKVLLIIVGILLIIAAPPSISSHFIVFELAVIVGFYVITNVTHTLHTPLMSVTNAISGIIVIGALLTIGSPNLVVRILSFIAMAIASINVFGGFVVTHRMLKMFQRSS